MQIRFWGVRGSISAPGPDTSHYGGNTSCVDIRCGGRMLILDAGTGLRDLGARLARSPKTPFKEIHLLLSHFHIDHLTGLPFFAPLYQKGVTLNLYGPGGYRRPIEAIFSAFLSEEFFPVPLKKVPARLKFHSVGDESFRIPPFKITSFYINHPGRTVGYRIQARQRSLVYLTDHEPMAEFQHLKGTRKKYEEKLVKILKGANLLIHDAQFTNEEYQRYRGWGHSPCGYAVRLAQEAGVRRLVLFHHAPEHRDGLLSGVLRDIQRDLKRQKSHLQVMMGREGETIDL